MVVVKAQLTARKGLLRAVAAHPVSRSVRQCLAVGFGVPPAQGHIPFHILFLALFARVFSIAWVSNPPRICWSDVVVFDDELEIAAGTFKNC